jgi:preprotein translocase subunit SecA
MIFDTLIRKSAIKQTQKIVDQLNPKINVHLNDELSYPSVQFLKKFCPVVAQINSLESSVSALTTEQLRAKTAEFKARYHQAIAKDKEVYERLRQQFNTTATHEQTQELAQQVDKAKSDLVEAKKKILDAILPEAFAVVREAGKRVLNMRHFDVQLIGGMVLHNGNIAEMRTGEGKTLVATLAVYLNALTGEGVHVVTVNDYLAKRDRAWMGPLYEFLGLTVGVIIHDLDSSARREAYGADITYGTNNEFGFDYLRDNMVIREEEMVQRPHHFAVVDEVDSILIDEARTPLIISGPAEQSTDKYYRAFEISKQLKGRRITEKDEIDAKYKNEDLTVGFDYLADEKAKSISLTEAGEEKAAKLFGIDNLHEMNTIEYRHHILQAVKAKEFFKIDVDYVVKDGEVIIVDEFTGRLMPGRRWSDGLHQAVEAKEGIKIERENQTLATITFQNYFRLYEKLSGMTGTAETEALEFKEIYKLDCVSIPTNKPLLRINFSDSLYRSLREKYNAVVTEIEEFHKRGQPVLVGTISIEKSELLSRMLKQKGISHQVLNAKFHELEAHIIAQAGRHKAVTIATNMAGRGTDIMLGGNAEHLAQSLLAQKIKDAQEATEQERDEMLKKFIGQFRQQVKEEHDKVVELGGLHVIGTERHESRRIDNQLRGRQGRQGDPGSSRFFVSMEDDLMRLFGQDRIIGIMDKLGLEEGQVLEHPLLTRAIENAQKRVEGHNFEIRKHLLEYDNVMNRQREVIYSLRRSILESQNVRYLIVEAIDQEASTIVNQYFVQQDGDNKTDWDALEANLKSRFNYALNVNEDDRATMTAEALKDILRQGLLGQYEHKEKGMADPQHLRHMERMVLLHTIDSKWKDHLYSMDQLKEGVGLRSFGQRDPLIEYKKEGFQMFELMYQSIHQEVVEVIFKLQLVETAKEQMMRGVFTSLPQKLVHQDVSSLSATATAQPAKPVEVMHSAVSGNPTPQTPATPYRKDQADVGRNDPCPCGSGKKYKKCHGQ